MSRTSSVTWELIIIAGILLILPLSMVFAGGLFVESAEQESFFSPHYEDDFSDHTIQRTPFDGEYRVSDSNPNYYYENETGNNRPQQYIYTENQTGNEYQEVLIEKHTDDTDDFVGFISFNLGLNMTVKEAIEEDLSQVTITAEFPRNSTVDLQVFAGGEVGGEYEVTELGSKRTNTTNEMKTYDIDISFTRLLEADDDYDEGTESISVIIEQETLFEEADDEDRSDNQALIPGDSFKFDIDLMTDYTASPLITTNFFAGIMGGLSLMAGIFTSPWVDFKDVAGPIIGVIR